MKEQKEKGITLIALVVTIIVLLILAGISIMMLTGENSLINQAKQAKSITEQKGVEEEILLAYQAAILEQQSGSTRTLEEIMEENLKDATVTKENSNYEVEIPNKGTFEISENGTIAKKETVLEEITKLDVDSMELDGAMWLRVYNDSTEVTSSQVIYTSSNPDVAKVNKKGVVICGKTAGTCTITVKGANKEITCEVTSTASKVFENNSTENKTIKGTKGWNNPTIPAGMAAINTKDAKWDKEADNQEAGVKKGLVVMDKNGNQFVWVPVKDMSIMYETDSSNNKKGKLYSTFERDSLTPAPSSKEPTLVHNSSTNTGDKSEEYYKTILGFDTVEDFETEMTTNFNKMIDSVSDVGGFYIARYEMSKSGDTAESIANAKARTADSSSANTWYGLYKDAKTYSNSYVKSTMVWGSQYDQMMIWMTDNGIDVTDYNVHNGGTKNTNKKQLTGLNKSTDKINNVYDLYGGRTEWILEAVYSNCRAIRGGGHGTALESDKLSPSNRQLDVPTEATDYRTTRVALYIQ